MISKRMLAQQRERIEAARKVSQHSKGLRWAVKPRSVVSVEAGSRPTRRDFHSQTRLGERGSQLLRHWGLRDWHRRSL